MRKYMLSFLILVMLSGVFALNERESLEELSKANQTIEELKEQGFSVNYMSDLYIQAERAYEIAYHSEILRSEEVNYSQKSESRIYLSLIDWKNSSYDDVLVYTDKINERKDKTYLISDSLISLNESINYYVSKGVDLDNVIVSYDETLTDFKAERYDESEEGLQETNALLEQARSEYSTIGILRSSSLSFFQRYFVHIIIFLVILLIIIYFVYKIIWKRNLLKELEKLDNEEKVINKLMKMAQEERFVDNKIPDIVYQARMKKYQERLNHIHEMRPVLHNKLKGKKNNKYY